MMRFGELIGKCCPNFCGFFYCDDKFEMAYDLCKNGYNLVICNDFLLTCFQSLGCNSFCSISLNIWPEQWKEMYNYMCNWKLHEAYEVQNKLWGCIKDACNNQMYTCDWIEVFKCKFNKLADFNVGGIRKPQCTWWPKW